jgi:hypothetical protein
MAALNGIAFICRPASAGPMYLRVVGVALVGVGQVTVFVSLNNRLDGWAIAIW